MMGVYIKGVTKAEMLTIITQQGESIRTADIIEVAEPHGDLIDQFELNLKANCWMVSFSLGITLYDILDRFYKDAHIQAVIEAEDE